VSWSHAVAALPSSLVRLTMREPLDSNDDNRLLFARLSKLTYLCVDLPNWNDLSCVFCHDVDGNHVHNYTNTMTVSSGSSISGSCHHKCSQLQVLKVYPAYDTDPTKEALEFDCIYSCRLTTFICDMMTQESISQWFPHVRHVLSPHNTSTNFGEDITQVEGYTNVNYINNISHYGDGHDSIDQVISSISLTYHHNIHFNDDAIVTYALPPLATVLQSLTIKINNVRHLRNGNANIVIKQMDSSTFDLPLSFAWRRYNIGNGMMNPFQSLTSLQWHFQLQLSPDANMVHDNAYQMLSNLPLSLRHLDLVPVRCWMNLPLDHHIGHVITRLTNLTTLEFNPHNGYEVGISSSSYHGIWPNLNTISVSWNRSRDLDAIYWLFAAASSPLVGLSRDIFQCPVPSSHSSSISSSSITPTSRWQWTIGIPVPSARGIPGTVESWQQFVPTLSPSSLHSSFVTSSSTLPPTILIADSTITSVPCTPTTSSLSPLSIPKLPDPHYVSCMSHKRYDSETYSIWRRALPQVILLRVHHNRWRPPPPLVTAIATTAAAAV
jgi:hypothetical protein